MSRTPWPPRWFLAAIAIFAFAVVLGAVGLNWLTPLVIAPAGVLIFRGAWPFVTGRHAIPSRAVFGKDIGWIGRIWGAGGVLIGAVWAIGGIAGFLQQVA